MTEVEPESEEGPEMALILVTGASSGLGRDTATELIEQGHDVVVHARRRERSPADRVPWTGTVSGDLSDLAATQDVARQADEFGRFDAVIHNAGALRSPEAIPVNVIAPYVLTVLMLKPSRLIYLSSSMHRGGSADLGRLASGTASYSDTKLWVTTLSQAFAARWPDTVSHAVDPGWVPTRMGGSAAPDDLTEGRRTQVWLATAPEILPTTGGYWHHRRTERPHTSATDPVFQSRLIDELARTTGIALDAQ
jgi:NAD(P)-dependent dehydrogenase (short-subunit alcohol dehydrogenase family)